MNDIQPDLVPIDERKLVIAAHASGFLGNFLFPIVGPILFPFIFYLVFRDKDKKFFEKGGREAINFQISMTTYFILLSIALLISVSMLAIGIATDNINVAGAVTYSSTALAVYSFISIIGILQLVMTIVAIARTYKGEMYRYPFIFRILK